MTQPDPRDVDALVERKIITRGERAGGHHFDKDCRTCNAAQDWTNGEMDDMRSTITALQADVARLTKANGEAIALIDEVNERKPSRVFYGINQPLHAKLATVRATLARAALGQQP